MAVNMEVEPKTSSKAFERCCRRTEGEKDLQEKRADGIAKEPHSYHAGRSHPIQGTNHEDLRIWCEEHEL